MGVTDRVELRDVAELSARAGEVVARFAEEIPAFLTSVEVHHIGATALPFGHTKGDVDVNLRVGQGEFPTVVALMTEHHDVAQPQNWTPTFASFSTDRFTLPLGVQVTVIGSTDDFLVALRDQMRSEAELLRRYDDCKKTAAPRGREAYWAAKDEFIRGVLGQNNASAMPDLVARLDVRVEAVPAAVTFPLRQQVLRPHESIDQQALPGDEDPDTRHVAARTGRGQVVGTAVVRLEAPPWQPGAVGSWRLRGMATHENVRGRGVGTRVLDAVLAHVASHGGGLLWCNARVPAKAFYERAGFIMRGEPWIDPEIGPHVAMWRQVEGP